tara:strand:+ start:456 stop:803 length:348 start_codon:yes stop_codon:yes gene_type:complete
MNNMTKLITLTEIYEIDSVTAITKSEDGRFTRRTRQFSLREVLVNPEYIVTAKEDERFELYLTEGLLPEGLNKDQRFVKLQLAGSNTISACFLVVVGDLSHIHEKTFGGRFVPGT